MTRTSTIISEETAGSRTRLATSRPREFGERSEHFLDRERQPREFFFFFFFIKDVSLKGFFFNSFIDHYTCSIQQIKQPERNEIYVQSDLK